MVYACPRTVIRGARADQQGRSDQLPLLRQVYPSPVDDFPVLKYEDIEWNGIGRDSKVHTALCNVN